MVKLTEPPHVLFFQKDFYEPPQVPLEKETFYSQEFTQKKTLPEIRRCEPPRENFRRTSAKFDGRTTYQDHHKHWKGQKQVPFGELPSFVGKRADYVRAGFPLHFIQSRGSCTLYLQ